MDSGRSSGTPGAMDLDDQRDQRRRPVADTWMVAGRTFAGKLMVLPAQLDSFTKPREGVYRLNSTGEEVTDPHWFTTWMVTNADQVKTKPAKEAKAEGGQAKPAKAPKGEKPAKE